MQLVRRPRAIAPMMAALAATLLLSGCAADTAGTAGDTPPAASDSAPVTADTERPDTAGAAGDVAPTASGQAPGATETGEVARMQKLLDGADSAANDADADAAADE
ncbi:hypothetical protein [Streptomyces sp. ISL-100]|uniref:hypothetical protein n=1 Tax=Streptomyces sp. ISL-100 TaxID=2819173 RepID=UPI001BE95834|nr:hypothetical protein [Streptomyces sp. ISL-100]MBT2401379.1 hypothetical protein [Streptomyces sp. ISL-100]